MRCSRRIVGALCYGANYLASRHSSKLTFFVPKNDVEMMITDAQDAVQMYNGF